MMSTRTAPVTLWVLYKCWLNIQQLIRWPKMPLLSVINCARVSTGIWRISVSICSINSSGYAVPATCAKVSPH